MFESADGLERLNDDQRRAAVHDGGPLLILAGAGTGKTGTLVARATWLRSRGIPASRILLLTFTRRAADDIMARVAPASAAASERICGGTFHAIAHRIIREHAESFALPPEFSVLDPADVTDLMDRLRSEHGLVGTARLSLNATASTDIYTRCVNTRTTVAEVVQAGFPWCTDFTAALSGLFRGYVAHKRQHGLVDFDDLLLVWRAALADEAAGAALRGLFGAVLVDEYQDVNAVQADIVRLLRPDGQGLTCVGDDAQAIYGFRGADPAHLRALTATYPDLTVLRLGRNYRSRQAVLGLANAVRPQSDGLELGLTADRPGGSPPLLVRCHDEATQAREICARVLTAHENGTDLRDQAVLVRTAHHTDVLEIELAARGIPFRKYGGLKFTEAAHVKDFLAAAWVVANPADDLAWFRLLRLHEGIGPVLARRVTEALALTEPGPLTRWPDALALIPARARPAVGANVAGLITSAGLESTAQRANVIRQQVVTARRVDRDRAGPAGVRRRPGRPAPPGRGLPDHLHRALGQGPGMAGRAPAAPGRRGGAQRHGARHRGGAGRGAPAVLRRGHPGPGPAVPVRAAAHAPPAHRPRRPAQLRAADPVPGRRRAGPGRGDRRGPAGAAGPAGGRAGRDRGRRPGRALGLTGLARQAQSW